MPGPYVSTTVVCNQEKVPTKKRTKKIGALDRNLGTAHYRAGDWKAAARALEKAKQLTPDGACPGFVLALAYWQLGDQEQARKCYDHSVRWMEKNKPAHEELRRFHAEAATLLGVGKEK